MLYLRHFLEQCTQLSPSYRKRILELFADFGNKRYEQGRADTIAEIKRNKSRRIYEQDWFC